MWREPPAFQWAELMQKSSPSATTTEKRWTVVYIYMPLTERKGTLPILETKREPRGWAASRGYASVACAGFGPPRDFNTLADQ